MNTINNVPRELLADLLGNDHDKRIMAERHLLAMLANAPSPAGVDGLDGVSERIARVWIGHTHIDDLITIGKEVDDAQAIIDGLRGENQRLQQEPRLHQSQIESSGRIADRAQRFAVQLRTELDQQAQRIGELEGLLREAYKYPLNHACETVDFTAQDLCERIDAALSAGKEGE